MYLFEQVKYEHKQLSYKISRHLTYYNYYFTVPNSEGNFDRNTLGESKTTIVPCSVLQHRRFASWLVSRFPTHYDTAS